MGRGLVSDLDRSVRIVAVIQTIVKGLGNLQLELAAEVGAAGALSI